MLRAEFAWLLGSVLLFMGSTSLRNPIATPLRLNQLQYRGATVSGGDGFNDLLDRGIRSFVWELDERGAEPGLERLREWSLQHPNHLPILVSIQPQGVAQLEMVNEAMLNVFQRRDFLQPKDIQLDRPSLRAAVLDKGWPEVLAMRGRFVFTLHDKGALRDAYQNLENNDLMFLAARDEADDAAAWWLLEETNDTMELSRDLVRQGHLVHLIGGADAMEHEESDAHVITAPTSRPRFMVRSHPVTRSALQGEGELEGPLEQWTVCEGTYDGHVQGVATDGVALYWSHTTRLVKTDLGGKLLCEVTVPDHHGDLTWHDGKVYVAVEFGEFNQPPGKTDSWVYVYEDASLGYLQKHAVPELVHGSGGIAYHDGTFVLVGGLPRGAESNVIFTYDDVFQYQAQHLLPTGYTVLGIQTVAYFDEHWWFGCYGLPLGLIKVNSQFQVVGTREQDFGYGISGFTADTLLRGDSFDDRHRGKVEHVQKTDLLLKLRNR